jgi:hypothetical protein
MFQYLNIVFGAVNISHGLCPHELTSWMRIKKRIMVLLKQCIMVIAREV